MLFKPSRGKLYEKAPQGSVVAGLLRTPELDPKLPALSVEYLSVDFETTGLNAKKESILSVGYTLIRHGVIVMSESRHHIIRSDTELSEDSVIVHNITHDKMEQGKPLDDVMNELFLLMQNRVLLVHFKNIEQSFIDVYTNRTYGFSLPMQIVDTMAIAHKEFSRSGFPPVSNSLRLFNLRKQFNLPRYKAHNAMMDAIATAELFLAQLQHKTNPHLGDILS